MVREEMGKREIIRIQLLVHYSLKFSFTPFDMLQRGKKIIPKTVYLHNIYNFLYSIDPLVIFQTIQWDSYFQ